MLEQEHGDRRGPDLRLQGVGAGTDEGLDAQSLFQGLEEKFYLPAAFVNAGDGGCGEMATVGEKDQGALVLLIPELDAAQEQVARAGARHH